MYNKPSTSLTLKSQLKSWKPHVPQSKKHWGSQVKYFAQEIWEANWERIVEEGTYFKFKYGEDEGRGRMTVLA